MSTLPQKFSLDDPDVKHHIESKYGFPAICRSRESTVFDKLDVSEENHVDDYVRMVYTLEAISSITSFHKAASSSK